VDDNISPYPWQTDTCVGEWYYKRSLYDNHQYKTTETVLHMLADIVSKNGNLLLNFPLRGDGTLDADEQKILGELAAWMPINGEAIFGTRPWAIYGEGPSRVKGGMFNEGKLKYTAQDIRFTQKDGALYALMLGWPTDGKVFIRSLGQPTQGGGEVQDVRLLGYPGKLVWTQTTQGLAITLPPKKPCDFAYAFKIAGRGLKPVVLTAAPVIIQPSKDGTIVLSAAQAAIHGTSPQLETKNDGDDIGYWDSAADYVSWEFDTPSSGTYLVSVSYSCARSAAGSAFIVEAAGQSLTGTSESTGSWDSFAVHILGTLTFAQTGRQTLAFKPQAAPPWKAVGLRSITLTKSG
jgi:alpha-L-fucosidase